MDFPVVVSNLEPHSWLEKASWIAQIGLAVTAIISVVFGAIQLWFIRQDGKQRTLQQKAEFLFDLDKMFESDPFTKSRVEFERLISDTEGHIESLHPHLDLEGKRQKVSEEFSKRLYELRNNAPESYQCIMRLCGFFETAGMLVSKGYAMAEDIFELYGGAIIALYDATHIHITKRQENGMPPGYLENFLYLAAAAKKP